MWRTMSYTLHITLPLCAPPTLLLALREMLQPTPASVHAWEQEGELYPISDWLTLLERADSDEPITLHTRSVWRILLERDWSADLWRLHWTASPETTLHQALDEAQEILTELAPHLDLLHAALIDPNRPDLIEEPLLPAGAVLVALQNDEVDDHYPDVDAFWAGFSSITDLDLELRLALRAQGDR